MFTFFVTTATTASKWLLAGKIMTILGPAFIAMDSAVQAKKEEGNYEN